MLTPQRTNKKELVTMIFIALSFSVFVGLLMLLQYRWPGSTPKQPPFWPVVIPKCSPKSTGGTARPQEIMGQSWRNMKIVFLELQKFQISRYFLYMYMNVYVYIYIYILHIVYVHIYIHIAYCVCIYIYTHCMYIYIHIVCAYIYKCIYISKHTVCMYICIDVYLYICIYVNMYICIYV